MKKLVVQLLILLMVTTPVAAHAFYYEAKCMVPQGKFKKCFLDFSNKSSMKLTYKDFEFSTLNRTIAGKDIRDITMGEKAQHRWAAVGGAIYALGPIGALFLLWKKKSAIFNVEFKGQKDIEAVMFGVPKKKGPVVSEELRKLSGKEVHL